MTDLNRLVLIGNVGTDAEYVAFESGAVLTKFTMAVARYDNKNKTDITDWFKVETFSKLGEYVKKGHKIAIDGSITTNVWENKDGKKVKDYIVKANSIQILTKKADGNSSEDVSQDETGTAPEDAEQEIVAEDFEDEEIPF